MAKPKKQSVNAWRERNRDRYNANCARWRRENQFRAYGLTRAQFDDLLIRSAGCCEICDTQFGEARETKMCIDHDHATGHVRGLLCMKCNLGLGYIEKHLSPAMSYLTARIQ